MAKSNIVVGTVTGTGSAINVSLGFIPAYVRVVNETDAKHPSAEWFNTMADAEMFKGLSVDDDGSTGDSSFDFTASDGISAYAGVAGGAGAGFTIGADSDLNAASDVLHYIAMRADG